MSIQFGIKSLHVTIGRDGGFPELHMSFARQRCFMQLNYFFLNNGVGGMLKVKDCCAADIEFPILGAHIHRLTALLNEANMAGHHSYYFHIVFQIGSQNYGRGWTVTDLEKRRRDVRASADKVGNMFSSFYASCSFTRTLTLKLAYIRYGFTFWISW